MTLGKTGVILLVLLLVAMTMIPMVSATQDQGISAGSRDTVTESDIPAPVPYANIYLYGPEKVSINEEVKIYTSGQIGNFAGTYVQRFYIKNLDTGSVDGVTYISTPAGWGKSPLSDKTWEIWKSLALQDRFTSSWTVKLTQKGSYEVVVSVVGAPVIVSDQTRLVYTIS